MATAPSGKRPSDTPVCCAPKLLESIALDALNESTNPSPLAASPKFAWSAPAPGVLSAQNRCQPFVPPPMNDSACMGDFRRLASVSDKNNPPIATGCTLGLYSSNQSSPELGCAIHSLILSKFTFP